MSQKKAKELRRALEQYDGVVQDVDRLKHELAEIRRDTKNGLDGLMEALDKLGEVETNGRREIFAHMQRRAETEFRLACEVEERLRRHSVVIVAALTMGMVALGLALGALATLLAGTPGL